MSLIFDAAFVFGGMDNVLDERAWTNLQEQEPDLARELQISVLRGATPQIVHDHLVRRGAPEKLVNWLRQAAAYLCAQSKPEAGA
jgi:hypothetical protein